MKNIRDVFNSFSPDGAQTARIAAGIERRMHGVSARRAHPIRRTAVIIAAAVLLAAGTFTAAAYVNPSLGEAVRRIFTREEELIDAHAVVIDARDERGGASLVVEKAVRDGATTYLWCTVKPAEGMISGQLFTAEHISLTHASDEFDVHGNPVRRIHSVMHRQLGMPGIFAGDILEELPAEPAESIRWILPLQLGANIAGEYTLTLTEPFTTVSMPDGTFPRTVLADELSVSFTLSDITEELDVYEVFPLTEYAIGGGTIRLKSVRITPLEVRVIFDDPTGEPVPVPGHPELQVPVTEFLGAFASLFVWDNWSESPLGSREAFFELTRGHCWGVRLYIRDGDEIRQIRGAGSSTWRWELNDPIYPEDVYKITLNSPNDEEIVIWTGNGVGSFLEKAPHTPAKTFDTLD